MLSADAIVELTIIATFEQTSAMAPHTARRQHLMGSENRSRRQSATICDCSQVLSPKATNKIIGGEFSASDIEFTAAGTAKKWSGNHIGPWSEPVAKKLSKQDHPATNT